MPHFSLYTDMFATSSAYKNIFTTVIVGFSGLSYIFVECRILVC